LHNVILIYLMQCRFAATRSWRFPCLTAPRRQGNTKLSATNELNTKFRASFNPDYSGSSQFLVGAVIASGFRHSSIVNLCLV
jgi:hypothetical protein